MQPIRQVAFASSGSLLRPCRTRNVGNPGGLVTFWILTLATPSPHSDGNGGDDTHVLINQYPPVPSRKPGRAQLCVIPAFHTSTGDLPPYVSADLCRQVPVSTTADVATGTSATDRSTVDSSRAICSHALTSDLFIRLDSPPTLRLRPGCRSHMRKCEQVMPNITRTVQEDQPRLLLPQRRAPLASPRADGLSTVPSLITFAKILLHMRLCEQ